MNETEFLWVEKYRPAKIDDVILPKAIKEQFKGYVRDDQIQNMLLSSPTPGTGKTTVALALCEEMGIKPLFINASLNNSIEEIRVNVLQYATTVSLVSNSTKVVILDEAERLTPGAQDSLKGLIEMVSKNCRFILTANTKSRIIEPLRSRCPDVEFVYGKEDMKSLSAQMYKRACEILDAENVVYSKPVIAKLVTQYMPDNRKIIGKLQHYAAANKVIDEGILAQMIGGDITALLQAMKDKKFDLVKGWCFDNQDRLGDDFYGKMFAATETKVEKPSIPELVMILDEWQTKHKEVPDRFIHFLAMCTHVMMRCTFL